MTGSGVPFELRDLALDPHVAEERVGFEEFAEVLVQLADGEGLVHARIGQPLTDGRGTPRHGLPVCGLERLNNHERLAVLNRLAIFHQDPRDPPGGIGFDLVHHLHRFDNADRITNAHLVALLDKGWVLG